MICHSLFDYLTRFKSMLLIWIVILACVSCVGKSTPDFLQPRRYPEGIWFPDEKPGWWFSNPYQNAPRSGMLYLKQGSHFSQSGSLTPSCNYLKNFPPTGWVISWYFPFLVVRTAMLLQPTETWMPSTSPSEVHLCLNDLSRAGGTGYKSLETQTA